MRVICFLFSGQTGTLVLVPSLHSPSMAQGVGALEQFASSIAEMANGFLACLSTEVTNHLEFAVD